MRRIALASAVTVIGAGLLVSTSGMAFDDDGYRRGFRTTIHEYDEDGPPPPRHYGYRGVRFGDVLPAPRYRTRRITREVIEYDNDDDFDD